MSIIYLALGHFTISSPVNYFFNRHDIADIATEIDGKTADEVKKYSKTFWSRYKEISDYERYITKIEKGESELEKQAEIQEQLAAKIGRHRLPLQQMKIHYTQPTKGKNYTEEEDRFLIVMLEKYGYGTENVYDKIRQEIKGSPLFRFDWFLKSRTSQEISRRCNTLISLIQKENAELEEETKEDKKVMFLCAEVSIYIPFEILIHKYCLIEEGQFKSQYPRVVKVQTSLIYKFFR
jgi:hypothetical protein